MYKQNVGVNKNPLLKKFLEMFNNRCVRRQSKLKQPPFPSLLSKLYSVLRSSDKW